MPGDRTKALRQLNDSLAEIISQAGVEAERKLHSVALIGVDVEVAITAIWDPPFEKPPGEHRVCGVEIAIHSPKLFGGQASEYSYGGGLDDDAGLLAALENWVAFDLPVLAEAASDRTSNCVVMTMTRNAVNGIAPGTWQIYAGPLSYIAGDAGAAPCYNTCLLMMSMPSLLPLMTKPISFAIKIVASKDEDGTTAADCRRNGEDVPDAIFAIAEAAKTWPVIKGTQMRRQYFYFEAPHMLSS